MPQLSTGDTIMPRVLTTIRSEAVPVPDPERLVHMQFRRFAGCPICNVHLRSIARRHDDIQAAGIREVAVFHSPAGDMLPHQGDLPFPVVADPQRLLYVEFGVGASRRAVTHPSAWFTPFRPSAYPVVLRGLRNGGSPGPRHGETVLGLPADFLIDPTGRVVALRYGRHANDQWTVDELIELANQRGSPTAQGMGEDRPAAVAGRRRWSKNPTMIGRLEKTVFDCPDPRLLATFYATILGMRVNENNDDWVVIGSEPGARQLAFQRTAHWTAPRWPDPHGSQQLHLDIRVEDVDAAETAVLALGARRLHGASETGFRVFADPAGHPFCLVFG